MRLFKEIVRHVWKQKLAKSGAVLRAATGKLADLADRKNRLVDFLLEARIDQQTYDEQVLRLKAEVDAAEQELRDADLEQLDVEAVLEFAEKLVERPEQLWMKSLLEQKQRLQSVLPRRSEVHQRGIWNHYKQLILYPVRGGFGQEYNFGVPDGI